MIHNETICHLTQLIYLKFGRRYGGPILTQDAFRNLHQLQCIVCTNINHISNDAFAELSGLKELDLYSGSNLSPGPLVEITGSFTLTRLKLDSFNIIYFPFERIHCIETLILSECTLSDDSFLYFTDITSLIIIHCNTVTPLLLHYLPKLKSLQLDICTFKVFQTEICKKMYKDRDIAISIAKMHT